MAQPEDSFDESGCTVDWSWLAGRQIASVTSDLQRLTITFVDGERLIVQAALYEGRPFLAFTPWKES